MNDAVEWLREQLRHDTRKVARDLLAHLDGEPERLAAARTEAADRAWDEAVKATELEQAHVRLRAVAAAREEALAEARVRLAVVEAQVAEDDKRAVEVNDAHLKQVATLRARVAELEVERDEWFKGYHEMVGRLKTALAKYPEGK